jgi:MoxR-like ATPase
MQPSNEGDPKSMPVEHAPNPNPVSSQPERLIPPNFGTDHLVDQAIGNSIASAENAGESPTPNREKVRKELLRAAPDFNTILKQEYRELARERNKGKKPEEQEPEDPPENKNLALSEIKAFRRVVKEAQSLRKVVRSSTDPAERLRALDEYAERKRIIDKELADYGLSFQHDYREYLSAQGDYMKFMNTLHEVTRLEGALQEPSFKELPSDVSLDVTDYSRLERVMHDTERQQTSMDYENIQQLLAGLETIYPKGSPEYVEAERELLIENPKLPPTKKELEERVVKLREKANELWQDSMVQYFYYNHEYDVLLKDFGEGSDVIETPSVITTVNKLHDWETQHQRTTIGGVLVGPPGVGKTTLVHHYLEAKGRNYVYIDLSEDVTRYLLYGSKDVSFKSTSEQQEALFKKLNDIDPESFDQFIQKNSGLIKNTFGLNGDEATVVLLSQIDEEIKHVNRAGDADDELRGKLNVARDKILGLAREKYHKELGTEFSHIVKKNGWRDGVIVAALRRGDNILFDEFNKAKSWSLIYGLMTAKPGEKWYFADNDEWIDIPDNWRMYFTANIGKKHGVYQVAEALASRAGGKVIEVDHPPVSEQMRVSLVSLSNAEGDFQRSKDDLAKLFVLINEVFPSIRKYTADKNQAIPISYRTIRDLGEKLLLYKDPKSGKPVYQPTERTFDQALYEVLIDTYSLYEDKTIPKEIVNLATSSGLLLDDSVRRQVEQWISPEEFKKRQDTFNSPEKKKDFNQIVDEIRGLEKNPYGADYYPQVVKT